MSKLFEIEYGRKWMDPVCHLEHFRNYEFVDRVRKVTLKLIGLNQKNLNIYDTLQEPNQVRASVMNATRYTYDR